MLIPWVLFTVAVGAILTALSPLVWLTLLTDGLYAVAVVASAAGWGMWPAAWLGYGRPERGKQLCLATALGLGFLSSMTLGAGVAGVLTQPAALTLLAAGVAIGIVHLYVTQQPKSGDLSSSAPEKGSDSPSSRALLATSLGLLALAIPAAIMLFGACLPPGILWPGEAGGYDVLEYHLQCPREYFDAGRITFLPHNVYASFPQQMEMLYLLLMHALGDAHAAAIPAQLLHAVCGILLAITLACWTPRGWPRLLVLVIAGSTPWLAYLGCLAYVELGMLLFAAVAAGIVVDSLKSDGGGTWRMALAAGLCAGLAGGCKYTALVFVVVGIGVAWFVAMRAPMMLRVRRIAVFGISAVLAFSPWLIRNTAFTGNPVYPFAYSWFGGTAWSAAQDAQWKAGHGVPDAADSVGGRFALGARELFGQVNGPTASFTPTLFGQVLFLFALVGLIRSRSRTTLLLSVWTLLILAAWLWLTFVPGRFAVPIIIPLGLLAANVLTEGTERRKDTASVSGRAWPWVALAVALAGAAVNSMSLAGRLKSQSDWWQAHTGVALRNLPGMTSAFVENHPLNVMLPQDANVWLVGDARPFYVTRRLHYTVAFCRDPWLEHCGAGADPAECIAWLRERGVSHVAFNWDEINRLRNTYGFALILTPEWVAGLEAAGLLRVRAEGESEIERSALAVYEIPQNDG